MPNFEELEKTPRRELHIFYVLDTSGSMGGTPIATLNRALEETVEILKNQAKRNADALIKISVLEFNSGCHWVNSNGPEEMDDFIWQDLSAGGITDVGAALLELDSKLSRKSFLSSMTGAYLPVIIFMSDGNATDDYSKALDKIRENKWFAKATKIGFAIGDADVKMISEVVGNPEAVVQTDDLEIFARLIKFASVTASVLSSESRISGESLGGAAIVKQVIEEDGLSDSVITGDFDENCDDIQDDSDNDDGWGNDTDWE